MCAPTVYIARVLGVSAFAGFLVLDHGWPLNSYVMKRSIGLSNLKKASLHPVTNVNEPISAVLFHQVRCMRGTMEVIRMREELK